MKKMVEGCRLKVEQRKYEPTYEDFSKWWTCNGGEGLASFMQHYCDIEFLRRKLDGHAFRADTALYGALRELREDLFKIIGCYMTKVVGNPPARRRSTRAR